MADPMAACLSRPIHEPQAARSIHKQLGFATRQSLELIDAIPRTMQNTGDLAWKIVMKKPQNEDTPRLRRLFPRACISTNLVQVFGSLHATRGFNRRPAKPAGVVVGN